MSYFEVLEAVFGFLAFACMIVGLVIWATSSIPNIARKGLLIALVGFVLLGGSILTDILTA